MSGSNRLPKADAADYCGDAPAVILVETQLGENIGMVCRAMLNCGLSDLRLVNPREGWSREKAEAAAVGATVVLENMKVFDTTEEAIADLNAVYATTARGRDMSKPVLTPRRAAADMRGQIAGGLNCGILFGKEAKGLSNEDVVLADTTISVPLNPAYSSLNLAQAVLLAGYEWFQAGDETPELQDNFRGETRPANKKEMQGLFEHLEESLDTTGFLWPLHKRPTMVNNIRNTLQKARMTEQEVRTWRGIIVSFMKFRRQAKDK